jgi:hypothetical protein
MKLAEADSAHHNVVSQVQEVFADFQAINHDLYQFNIPTLDVFSLARTPYSDQTIQHQATLNKLTDQLFALLVSSRSLPLIRYSP